MNSYCIVGCGYVGSALATQLTDAGHTVYGVRRSPVSDVPYTALQADVQEPDSLSCIPEGLDGLIYCISAATYDVAGYKAAYYDGLKNVLDHLRTLSALPKRIVFVSSSGVYHQQDGSRVDEGSPAQPTNPAARWLLAGEALLYTRGLPATVVRFSGIYGPDRTRTIDLVRSGKAVCTTPDHHIMNHIHRDDCAGVLHHILQLEEPRALYLGTDSEPVSRNTAYWWLSKQLGVPTPEEEAVAEEAAPKRGGYRRYSNQALLDSGYTFLYPTYREGYGALIDAMDAGQG